LGCGTRHVRRGSVGRPVVVERVRHGSESRAAGAPRRAVSGLYTPLWGQFHTRVVDPLLRPPSRGGGRQLTPSAASTLAGRRAYPTNATTSSSVCATTSGM